MTENEEMETLSTGTFQPQKSWYSRASQPNLRKPISIPLKNRANNK